MSPTTTSLLSTATVSPFRKIFAFGDESAFKADNDSSAFKCCTVPSIALITTTNTITIVLSYFSNIPESNAATNNIQIKKSLNCDKKTMRDERFLDSRNSLEPYLLRIVST